MPTFVPEGNRSLPSDNEIRSLWKIVDLGGGGSGSGGGAQQVFAGSYNGQNPTTFGVVATVTGSIATDLDGAMPQYIWNGSAWI